MFHGWRGGVASASWHEIAPKERSVTVGAVFEIGFDIFRVVTMAYRYQQISGLASQSSAAAALVKRRGERRRRLAGFRPIDS
jgi:hypothetical protein